MPSSGSASTSSPLATTIPSALPNSPRCADPTLSTTPTWGRATRQSRAMCPGPREPISSTRNRVRSSASSTVSGRPMSLLYDPGGLTVGPGRGEHLTEQVLGRGLARGAGDADRAQAAGREPGVHAGREPAERHDGVVDDHGRQRVVGTRGDRRDGAGGRGGAAGSRAPSARSPATATNSAPSATVRESRVTAPVTVASAGPVSVAAGELGDLGERERDHAGARPGSRATRTSRSTVRSSKGCTVPAIS